MQHLSFSQYNSYVECPRSWYLSKVRGATERPTWYLLMGTVVHSCIEAHLQGEPYDLEQMFYRLVLEQRMIEPDVSQWMYGGSESDPIVRERALQRARECLEAALEYLQDVDVWEVEYDASGALPGLSLPVKAYVDIIGEHKKHGPVIIDWKTGKNKPKSNFQLETYRALLHGTKYSSAVTGLWAMLSPEASKARPIDLSSVDPSEVGAKYQAVYERMMAAQYKANVRFACKFCFHEENCLARSGPTKRARYWDRSEEDGIPF